MTEEYYEKKGLFEDLGDEVEPLTEEELDELFRELRKSRHFVRILRKERVV
jgi:hypothetical protein